MKDKFTPRPWSYGIGNRSHEIYDANGALVCTVFNNVQDRFLIVDAVNKEWEEKKLYPCDDCGKLRTKAEGGTTFTICDECWEKKHGKP